jgi:hypothetical protein
VRLDGSTITSGKDGVCGMAFRYLAEAERELELEL